jgi:hypothetical protein
MKIGKIKAELMNVHEEMRKIEAIRTHSTEIPTCIGTDEPAPGALFLAPAPERSVAMICWKRVPRLGKLGNKWSGVSARRLPDLCGRKVRLSEPEAVAPPLPEPVAPPKQEPPPSKKETREPVVTKTTTVRQVPEKRSRAVTPAENQKQETAKEKVPVIPEEPPKPLKVIRRRREQAPKVFETAPKNVPLAMLEGIASPTDEDAST